MNFVLRILGIFVAVMVCVYLLPGITLVPGDSQVVSVGIIALIIAVLNCTIKPILQFLGTPITILSLGIFYLVINALLLYLAAAIGNSVFNTGFYISNFADAFVGAIIISIVSSIMNAITGAND